MKGGPCTCCKSAATNRGPWTPEEDGILRAYIKRHGEPRNWRKLPKAAALQRCGKSCRLRWRNYLRPDLKRGSFTEDETELIIRLHSLLGNRWSLIAGRIPGRSDNEIKNYWNFHLSKKLSKSVNNGSIRKSSASSSSGDSASQESPSSSCSTRKRAPSPGFTWPGNCDILAIQPNEEQQLHSPSKLDLSTSSETSSSHTSVPSSPDSPLDSRTWLQTVCSDAWDSFHATKEVGCNEELLQLQIQQLQAEISQQHYHGILDLDFLHDSAFESLNVLEFF